MFTLTLRRADPCEVLSALHPLGPGRGGRVMAAVRPTAGVPVQTPAQTSALIAQELRALALTGLAYSQDPYDVDRYRRVLALNADLAAVGKPVTGADVRRAYLAHVGSRHAAARG